MKHDINLHIKTTEVKTKRSSFSRILDMEVYLGKQIIQNKNMIHPLGKNIQKHDKPCKVKC